MEEKKPGHNGKATTRVSSGVEGFVLVLWDMGVEAGLK